MVSVSFPYQRTPHALKPLPLHTGASAGSTVFKLLPDAITTAVYFREDNRFEETPHGVYFVAKVNHWASDVLIGQAEPKRK